MTDARALSYISYCQYLQEFVCLAFSADDQLLVSISGAPDWKLTFWSWGKAQIVAECSVSAHLVRIFFFQLLLMLCFGYDVVPLNQ